MPDSVWLIGAAMTPFGRFADRDLLDLGSTAALGALSDAGITIHDIDVLAAGNVFQASSGVGQLLLQQIGQTGIPVYNVVNACATGATALRAAIMAIRAGEAEAAMAVGMEQMGKAGVLPTSLDPGWSPHEFTPAGRDGSVMDTGGVLGAAQMPAVFATAGIEYAYKHGGVHFAQFAKVAEKNHAHSTLNPFAQYRKQFTYDEIWNAPMVAFPNNTLMCAPTGDGAAAAIVVSQERLGSLSDDQRRRAVKISASVLTSDPWNEAGEALPDFNTLTRNAAVAAYDQAGVAPVDLDLVELHDCFATAELLHYDNLMLCEPGEAGRFIDEGHPWRGGSMPVNVSGGLLSKGHPVAATGIAGVYEIATHLRGEAGARQVAGAKVGLAHVLGLGSSCGVHILER